MAVILKITDEQNYLEVIQDNNTIDLMVGSLSDFQSCNGVNISIDEANTLIEFLQKIIKEVEQ